MHSLGSHIGLAAGLALAAFPASPSPVAGQGYPFSQRGSVEQDVAHTRIAVTYGRPVARGRALFGQLVPWDSIWHPGADSATRVTFNHDLLLEGHAMKAGEYSLWLIPREHAPWTDKTNSHARLVILLGPVRRLEVYRHASGAPMDA